MPRYKIAVIKNQKKYTIVVQSDSEREARDRIHNDWYSILNVHEIWDEEMQGQKFIFEAYKWFDLKKWKVVWSDIFKVYLKLTDWLWYQIKKLYSEGDESKTEHEKERALNMLEAQYEIFKNTKEQKKLEKESKEKNQKTVQKSNIDNFYVKKELEETHKLIDFVLLKLRNVLEKDLIIDIDIDKKEKLKVIYNNIIKIKNSTNISKLKQIWEKALLKIWELEIDDIDDNKNKKSEILLKWTNSLLKKIGSNIQFKPKEKDLKYILKTFFIDLKRPFDEIKEERKRIKHIDKTSNSYTKTLYLLDEYRKKLKENNLDILKNFKNFIYPFWKNLEKRDEILIKRSVIKQNITLLKAKKDWRIISYTKLVQWYKKILKKIFSFFLVIRTYLFYVVLIYSLSFILIIVLNYFWIISNLDWLNNNWIFYFIVFLVIYFAIYFSQWVYSLIINFLLTFWFIVFAVVNF